MALKLMFITNNPDVAETIEKADVDCIFIDLETRGKKERQGHLDTVQSMHNISDIGKVKRKIKKAKLLVRINPMHEETADEIDKVIDQGADIIMLPYYKSIRAVKDFLRYIGGRAKACLLCETPEAVEILDETIEIPGIDYMHIGLNDLHLGYDMKFMFEPLANGMVENICSKLEETNIKYGFGGIARLGEGMLNAEMIIAEHYRLGSKMAILSRSFCNINSEDIDLDKIEEVFKTGVSNIRDYEKSLESKSKEWFEDNKNKVQEKVNYIVSTK